MRDIIMIHCGGVGLLLQAHHGPRLSTRSFRNTLHQRLGNRRLLHYCGIVFTPAMDSLHVELTAAYATFNAVAGDQHNNFHVSTTNREYSI